MKPSKYKAIRTTVDGITFASKAEAKRDGELRLLLRAGHIRHLERQPKFDLVVNGVKVCRYIGDWRYTEVHNVSSSPISALCPVADVVEDKKGVKTAAFRVKWALAKALYPDIEWRLS